MYYRLEGNSVALTTYVDPINMTQESLIIGALVDEEEEELPYVYSFRDPAGNEIPDFFDGDNIMSKKMYDVLQSCGVDNIQVLPLEFINEENKGS